jgi:hypothetical protein
MLTERPAENATLCMAPETPGYRQSERMKE